MSAPVGVNKSELMDLLEIFQSHQGPCRPESDEDDTILWDRTEAAIEALAQQPAAVDGDWRKKAAEWLEAKAVEQEAANQRWPKHAACYKEWRDRPGILRHLAFQVLAAQQGGDT